MTESKHNYNPLKIETKWQAYWLQNKTFKTSLDTSKPKYYILDMFPYPSGAGLHVGHPEGYTATDILARYKRMLGFNVLHPVGWDAFGLPAEQYAIKTGTHPRDTTDANIQVFRKQIQSLGLSYDWDREIDTTAPDYYRWTQWIFLQLFKKGLAYESEAPVNWCPALGCVLANEEVIDGKSEVGGHPVEKRTMRQWVLKITQYAERLLTDLELLDWPESIKAQQRNWIGKSIGADVEFPTEFSDPITVFTTRPDTIFGVSFLALAPEHKLINTLALQNKLNAETLLYIDKSKNRSERERISDTTKTGVFTGLHAKHPISGEQVPIYVADYVIATYGHGALMGVPAHDQRDFDFASKFKLPILTVVHSASGPTPPQDKAFEDKGILVNSQFADGLDSDAASAKICAWLEKNKLGKQNITYKLRDWLFSRQRYWGEPIPVVRSASGKVEALNDTDLPLILPQLDDFKPADDGNSPLMRSGDWLKVKRNGADWTRETNTMPQWAGSCWYFLRFVDPTNKDAPWSSEAEKYWMPVDLYVGGAEHAVLHLLYARFWHKVLFDLGYVSTVEPFTKLVNQGMILGENGEKMSKSRGNVINPDDVVRDWGADSLRAYEMFMGPLTATKPWQTNGIAGVHRFLARVWRLFVDEETGNLSAKIKNEESSAEQYKLTQATIKKVTSDLEAMSFNTALSALMEWVNAAYKDPQLSRGLAEKFVLLLSPFAPHIAEELWEKLGHPSTLAYEPWPKHDESALQVSDVELSIQVNGKMRGTVQVAKDCDEESVFQAALVNPHIAKYLEGKTVKKRIYVANRMLSIVVA